MKKIQKRYLDNKLVGYENVSINEWNEKEVYYDEEGRVLRTSYAKEHVGKPAMKKALEIDVIIEKGLLITSEELREIMQKVDEIRNEQPLTEAHLIIKC